jgi:AraC-like DNA-binding protein
MKAVFQRLTTQSPEGFTFKELRSSGFNCPWHVHPEYELILLLSGSGYRVVGDNISRLGPGDLVMVGPDLPHIWQAEPSGDGQPKVHFLLLQFEPGCLGDGLLQQPVMEPVRRLLARSQRGLHVTGRTRQAVSLLLREMAEVQGMERVVRFLQILVALAGSKECELITSPSFAARAEGFDEDRMDRVFQFLNSQLGKPIRLSDAARIVHLSEGAFSRFFKAHTGKTFPQFINELRVGRACALLMEEDFNITEVAFACGFANLSNFNRQFLALKGCSPRQFRLQWKDRLGAAPAQ